MYNQEKGEYMNKLYMKKVIILLLICVVGVFFGCEAKESGETSPTNVQKEQIGKEIDISIISPTYPDMMLKDDTISKWEKYIKGLTKNINIHLKYVNRHGLSKSMFLNEDAIIYVDSPEVLNYLINEELIVPINDYINIVEDTIHTDSKALKQVTDMKGNIWALPSADKQFIYYREYDEELLNKIGSKASETIDELYTFLNDLSLYNNNKNERKYFSHFEIDSVTKDFKDIFNSFGCYFYTPYNDIYSYSYGYNPKTNELQDYINTDEFYNAMEFIKFLKDSNFITTVAFSQERFVTRYPVGRNTQLDNTSVLSNSNSTTYTEAIISNASFAFLKTNKNIEEIINWIANEVYLSEELVYAFRYGVENMQYKMEDGKVVPIKDEDGKSNMIRMSINIGNNPISTNYNTYSLRLLKEFKYKKEMSKNMYILFDEILNKDISIEKAISNYNNNSTDMEILEYLFSQNTNKD